ncbi:MAG: ATP-binding protein [Verrucomicrobiota bacterium]
MMIRKLQVHAGRGSKPRGGSEKVLRIFRKAARSKKPIRLLFSGPSGTGKTVAVALGSADMQKLVYKVSLSKLISNYIGETEKNLNAAIRKAERSNAILFFDEADALFGKRTRVRDAHKRYANQEVSYVLNRLWRSGRDLVFWAGSLDALDRRRLRRFQEVLEIK